MCVKKDGEHIKEDRMRKKNVLGNEKNVPTNKKFALPNECEEIFISIYFECMWKNKLGVGGYVYDKERYCSCSCFSGVHLLFV